MCLAVSFFFPTAILGEGETSILGIFDVGINETTGRVYIVDSGFTNDDLNAQLDASSTEAGLFQRGINIVTSFFQFIVDGLANILGIIKIFFAFLFSPFVFVLNPQIMGGAPFYVQMIFAIPLVFLCFMGIVKLVGGRN
jgi:hypothetical protein